jgi:hypothetical protein
MAVPKMSSRKSPNYVRETFWHYWNLHDVPDFEMLMSQTSGRIADVHVIFFNLNVTLFYKLISNI